MGWQRFAVRLTTAALVLASLGGLTSCSGNPPERAGRVQPAGGGPEESGDAITVAAVGDIQPPYQSDDAEGTAKAAGSAEFILGLGDYQYDTGRLSDYNAYFDKTWGPLVPKMYPVLGPTHDESWTGDPVRYFNGAGASGYQTPIKIREHTSYSFDKGAWHFIAIDDSCYRDTDNCDPSALLSWVKEDLAAHPNRCTLAYWHQAYFTRPSEEHDPYDDVRPVVEALYDAGVDVALQGHQHNYERFAPQTPDRLRDDERGIRAFVVGTGGIGSDESSGHAPNSKAFRDSTFGVLKMTLRKGGYDWRFENTGGKPFKDVGTGTCH